MSDSKIYTCGRCGATLPSGKLAECPQCKARLIGVRPADNQAKAPGLVAGFVFLVIAGGIVWFFWPQVSGWFAGKWTDPYQGTWVISVGDGNRDGRQLNMEESADFRVVIQGDRVEVRRLSAAEPDYVFTLKQARPATLDSPQAQGDCDLQKEGHLLVLRYARTGTSVPRGVAPITEGQARFVLQRPKK
jgi:hypothetical protein